MRKNAREMIFIPKDNILIYFKVRQIFFCTHKAHLWTSREFYDFSEKSLIFPSKIGESQKLCVHQRGTKKIYGKKLCTYI